MKCRYEAKLEGACPINGLPDHYEVIVERSSYIEIEEMLRKIGDLTGTKAFQEQLTVTLAEMLNATVTTVGYHYGVKTTCTAP